ncbi:MAG: hypothetical protein U0746_07745 [Gemmataceae bacterium]
MVRRLLAAALASALVFSGIGVSELRASEQGSKVASVTKAGKAKGKKSAKKGKKGAKKGKKGAKKGAKKPAKKGAKKG